MSLLCCCSCCCPQYMLPSLRTTKTKTIPYFAYAPPSLSPPILTPYLPTLIFFFAFCRLLLFFYLCLFVPCPTWCFAVSVIFVSFQFTVYPYRSLSSHPVRAMSRNVAPRHHVIKISRFCLNLSKHWLPNFLKGYVFASSFSRYLADAVIQNDLLCTNDKFCWSNLMFCSLVQWR